MNKRRILQIVLFVFLISAQAAVASYQPPEFIWLRKAMSADNFSEKLIYLEEALIINPYFYEGYFARAYIYQQAKEYKNAIEDYNKALELQPYNSTVYNNIANCYKNLKKYKRAIHYYSLSLDLEPQQVLPYYNRAIMFMETGDYRKALSDLNFIQQKDSDYLPALLMKGRCYLLLKDIPNAEFYFNRTIAIAPSYYPAYLDRTRFYLVKGEYEKAFADVEQAMRMKEEYTEAYMEKANLQLLLGQNEQALETVNTVRDWKDENAYFQLTRSRIFRFMGRYEESKRDLERCFVISPDYPLAISEWNNHLLRIGKYRDVLENCRKVEDEEDGIIRIPLQMDKLSVHMTLGEYRLASTVLDNLSLEGKEFPAAIYCKELIEWNAGNLKAAITNLNKSVSMNHRDYRINTNDFPTVMQKAEFLIHRGYRLNRTKDVSSALLLAQRAVELNPSIAATYQSRASVFLQASRMTHSDILLDQAIADFEKCATLDTNHYAIYFGLAEAKLQKVEWGASIELCEESLNHLMRAESLNNAYPGIPLSKAKVYAALGKKDLMMTNLLKAERLAPREPSVYQTALDCHLGRYSSAMKDTKAAKESFAAWSSLSKDPLVSEYRIALLAAAGDFKNAKKEMKRIMKGKKKTRDILYPLRKKEWERIVAQLNKKEAFFPDWHR